MSVRIVWQVVVVPLRVNVNLKTITVEELTERRKVCIRALLTTHCKDPSRPVMLLHFG